MQVALVLQNPEFSIELNLSLKHFLRGPQDAGGAVMLEREAIQRVVISCNDFAEAEKRSKHPSPSITLIL